MFLTEINEYVCDAVDLKRKTKIIILLDKHLVNFPAIDVCLRCAVIITKGRMYTLKLT